MRVTPRLLQSAFRMLFACFAGLLFTALPIHAEADPSGTYRCKTVEVGGKTVPCKAPSLILKSDGSYRMLSESGTYEIVAGRWFGLSAFKRHGRARLGGRKENICVFVCGGNKRPKVIRRIDQTREEL